MPNTVSIIIPCYNKRDYVAAAIESALAQTHPAEVIVVDDGSSDGSLEEIKRFDSEIRWVSGPNRGGSAARNIGLDMATGDWIQFLDADDILPPEKIAVQLARLDDSPEGSMGFCPWSYFHNDGRIDSVDERRFWSDRENGLSLLIDMWHEGGFFPPHVWLTPRDLIDRAGRWNEKLTGDDDGEFFGRLLVCASEVRFCEDTCAYYRDPPAGSVSRDKSLKSARSFFAAFEVVANQILAARSDKLARKACLSRVRKTAYAWRDVPEVLNRAAAFEKNLSLFDFSPALPVGTRYLVALFGLKRGLQIRRLLQS